jgi:hypothetical protein
MFLPWKDLKVDLAREASQIQVRFWSFQCGLHLIIPRRRRQIDKLAAP